MTMKWGVWCTTSGGVTGHREAWAKSNNKIMVLTEEEARKYAAKWTAGLSPYGSARITYTAKPMEEVI